MECLLDGAISMDNLSDGSVHTIYRLPLRIIAIDHQSKGP